MKNALRFSGRSAREAKRRALNYWYVNRGELGMSLSDFFAQCRVASGNGLTCITFYPEVGAAGERYSAA